MTGRIHIFNPGPAALPESVLEEAQQSLLNYKETGMSVLEMSHRSKEATEIINDAKDRVKRLLGCSNAYHVLFLQGGASSQFHMVPQNFLSAGATADYIDTGTWSTKAIKEATILGYKINTVASSENRNYAYIPEDIRFTPGAEYVHLTSNNTIKGTQWAEYPDTAGVPIISDMSSDLLSRPFDVSKFGLIYAGAQKNLGPAGVTLVLIRQDMVDKVKIGLPSMMSYQVQVSKGSLYNTPPVFGIYIIQLVLKWLEETVGGVNAVQRLNEQKAGLLYQIIDESDFYQGTAEKGSRSKMNVTFRLPTVDLEQEFVADALQEGLGGLKGHRSVGGCRASIYNAVSLDSVQALADFMKEFLRRRG